MSSIILVRAVPPAFGVDRSIDLGSVEIVSHWFVGLCSQKLAAAKCAPISLDEGDAHRQGSTAVIGLSVGCADGKLRADNVS